MIKPPQIKIETLTQETVKSGFLGIDRRKVKFTYPDDSTAEMVVDAVIKNCNDAVAIMAHYLKDGERYVYLRSCVRPPLAFRDFEKDSGRPELGSPGNLWEMPAGLIDKEEFGLDGPVMAAKRELHEEIGIDAPLSAFKQLGPRSFSSVGMTAERIFYFEVEVNPITIGAPLEDGSPLEAYGETLSISLDELLLALNNDLILDAKTQMGIMRLSEKFK